MKHLDGSQLMSCNIICHDKQVFLLSWLFLQQTFFKEVSFENSPPSAIHHRRTNFLIPLLCYHDAMQTVILPFVMCVASIEKASHTSILTPLSAQSSTEGHCKRPLQVRLDFILPLSCLLSIDLLKDLTAQL